MAFMLKSSMTEISPRISFIVPCYNEERLIEHVLRQLIRVASDNYQSYEIIVVNDGSSDKTADVLTNFENVQEVVIIDHKENLGKGAAINSALRVHTGTIVAIQDADNEYDPRDLIGLISPILENNADVVYGSRFLGGKPRRAIYFSHAVGNRFLTGITNLLTGLNLTDMETGYKAMKSSILSSITIHEKRFGFEPEITVKLARIKYIRFYEVGISYYGRSFEEGKKIKWTDGIRALYCLFKYRIS